MIAAIILHQYLNIISCDQAGMPIFFFGRFYMAAGGRSPIFRERGAWRPFLSVSSSQSSWSSPPPRSPPPSWWWSHSWPGKQRGVCASNDAGQLEGTQHLLCKHSAMEFSVKEETGEGSDDCDWNDLVNMKPRWGSCSNKCWKIDLGDNRARNWWW